MLAIPAHDHDILVDSFDLDYFEDDSILIVSDSSMEIDDENTHQVK